MIMKKKISLIVVFIFINGCSLAPGMHMETNSTWLEDSEYVYIESINKNIDGLIYNAYAKPKGYYGYYGIYGNYSYQYYAEKYLDESYDYEKKD